VSDSAKDVKRTTWRLIKKVIVNHTNTFESVCAMKPELPTHLGSLARRLRLPFLIIKLKSIAHDGSLFGYRGGDFQLVRLLIAIINC
jgi:hypothetical protein